MAVFRIPVQRRFSDLDLMQHVNNVVYHDYLQEGRIRAIRQVLELSGAPITSQVLARQEINYRKPLLYRSEPLIVEVSVLSIGTSSYETRIRILDDDGSLAADALSVMVCFDEATQSPMPIPPDFRAALVSQLESS